MNNLNCSLIKDLLPLYSDGVCSEESIAAVEEHIASCSDCKNELEKISRHITIAPVKDPAPLKKIKKRITIITIAVAAVIGIASCFGSFFILNTDCSMDYEKYNLAEDVWVEEDNDGTLWLCKKNSAASADFIFPTLSDSEGRHLSYDKDYDNNKKVGYGITLKHRKIDSLGYCYEYENEERSKLENIKERGITQIFYYDDVNNKEYILWEE